MFIYADLLSVDGSVGICVGQRVVLGLAMPIVADGER